MELNYRGVRYQCNPIPVAQRNSTLAGKYRGVPMQFHPTQLQTPVWQPATRLTYRGVAYGQPPAAVATRETPEQPSIQEQMRQLTMQRLHKAQQRDLAVLERFEETIGLSAPTAALYNMHEATS